MKILSQSFYTSGMKKKKINLDDIALMMQAQFMDLKLEINGMKQDISGMKSDISGTQVEVKGIKQELIEINKRLDHNENLILTDHRNRLERLEDKVRILETTKKD